MLSVVADLHGRVIIKSDRDGTEFAIYWVEFGRGRAYKDQNLIFYVEQMCETYASQWERFWTFIDLEKADDTIE